MLKCCRIPGLILAISGLTIPDGRQEVASQALVDQQLGPWAITLAVTGT